MLSKTVRQGLMASVLSVLLCLAAFDTGEALHAFEQESSEVLTTTTRNGDTRIHGVRDRRNKDFVLGGLFPIHSDDPSSGGGECGPVRLERGLERMEAMLFALDCINNDPNLLANLSLGYDIRDTCNSENIGLDATIDLIITGSQLDIASCQSAFSTGSNDTAGEVELNAPTSGIVGAAASSVSVPVASLVRLFRTPQVSYASSSAILSNRDRYEYFYRTIPPDNLQAKAMVDLMLYFNWTYVSTIFSRNPYGEPGIVEFQTLADKNGICIDLNVGIEDTYNDEDFQNLANDLVRSEANVVILFSSQDNAETLLNKIAATTARNRFIWIASDAWARSINVVHQFNETAAGLFGIAPLTLHVSDFEAYFSNLTLERNRRNPWFPEFFAAFAECELNVTCDEHVSITSFPRYEQGNFIPLVIDAVYTFAHALDNFLMENCDQPLVWFRSNFTCAGQRRELDGPALLEYIAMVDFESPSGNRVLFDEEGNVEGRYEILNYQVRDVDGTREYFFESVGTWDSSVSNGTNETDTFLEALDFRELVSFQFGIDSNGEIIDEPRDSQCGRCEVGYFRRAESPCCAICDPCQGVFYSNISQANSCLNCSSTHGIGYWGNSPLMASDHCVKVREEFLDFSNPWAIAITILASLGLIAASAVTIIFAIYWKTPVVKSSGREQMVLLLVGIASSFTLAYIYVSPPSVGVCFLQRVGLWFCFSLMFGALLVKIVRVARIFLRKPGVRRPQFIEPYWQVIFTFIIVGIQLFIVVVSLAVQPPDTDTEQRLSSEPLDFPTLVVTCKTDQDAFLGLSVSFETSIIIVSTVLGLLSFKYPENFNEARYIAFCSFALFVVWVVFIPAYFATQSTQEFQNATISLAVVMSAAAVLVCIFGPKLFIILFYPEKNVPTDFNTSHGGYRTQSSNEFTLGGFPSSNLNALESSPTRSTVLDGEKKCKLYLSTFLVFKETSVVSRGK